MTSRESAGAAEALYLAGERVAYRWLSPTVHGTVVYDATAVGGTVGVRWDGSDSVSAYPSVDLYGTSPCGLEGEPTGECISGFLPPQPDPLRPVAALADAEPDGCDS